ncbi:condensation domain-containing protein [Streptomyces sp. V2I9]|uniref:condensation domain-containing protein n=1 Tax=Streptomyces sp. V2I9 TaxID=3042304 RepID=UPI00277EC128|nr:condensation domain-containing protein [Streptomyces sp. V2I9]MDQ0988760.1 hypothetical protein [Streptomyces sp. V2I9]
MTPTGHAPASVGQEALWLIDQFAGGSAQYTMLFAYRLRGQLDVPALEQALNQVIARHGAPRTTFVDVDGRPRQHVADELLVHLTPEPVPDQDEAVHHRLNQEAEHVFDLERGPLFTAGLLQRTTHDHVLMMVAHHAIFDGHSVDLLMEELEEFYTAHTRGRTPAVEPVAAHYTDFATAQHTWLQSPDSTAQLEFWRRTLQGATPLAPPPGRPPAALTSIAGDAVEFEMNTDTGALAALLTEERATPFMFMLAIQHLALARMSGQRDIVVASPMANRNDMALLKAMGYFVNIVGLRIDSHQDRTFRSLLKRVRGVALDAYENKDYPLAQLLARLGSRREGRPTALFETMFTYENIPARAEVWPCGLQVEAIDTDEVVVKSDLSFSVVSATRGFQGAICFRTTLYDREYIETLAAQFTGLVHETVRNPDAELDDLLAKDLAPAPH